MVYFHLIDLSLDLVEQGLLVCRELRVDCEPSELGAQITNIYWPVPRQLGLAAEEEAIRLLSILMVVDLVDPFLARQEVSNHEINLLLPFGLLLLLSQGRNLNALRREQGHVLLVLRGGDVLGRILRVDSLQ